MWRLQLGLWQGEHSTLIYCAQWPTDHTLALSVSIARNDRVLEFVENK